jgi:hypothetical protein
MMKRRPRIMLKVGVFLLLFLTGGAIVNVAVAWGCTYNYVYTVPPAMSSSSRTDRQWFEILMQWQARPADDNDYCVLREHGWHSDQLGPTTEVSQHQLRWSGLEEQWISEQYTCKEPPHFLSSTVASDMYAGWPVFSLHGCRRLQLGGDRSQLNLRGGFHPPLGLFGNWERTMDCQPAYFPLIPLWPGFAINTAFYAVILWLLWTAPRNVVRIRHYMIIRRRIREHRRPSCGHIIASGTCANGLCSECGAKLPFRVAEPAKQES